MRLRICTWDFVEILTTRAAEGIAEVGRALQLDRNLAYAHFAIGMAKVFMGRAEETNAHIVEALCLSPRDTLAYVWMSTAGLAKLHLGSRASGRVVSTGGRG